MRKIDVDDEVFALLQKNAKAFVDTPNSALRKLLGLRAGDAAADPESLLEEPMAGHRTKAPKASLRTLVHNGLLRNGERLYLVDFQGHRVGQFEATVAGALLEFKGQHFAMSNLAQELLKKVGFKSEAVRGPVHWVNAKGVSVKDLWQQLLDRRAKTAARPR
jgi:hypothetical protein